MYKLCIYFVVFFSSINSSISQSFILQGKIVDEANLPISNASIKILKHDSLGLIKYFSFTKDDGTFNVQIKSDTSKLWLQISIVGYRNFNKALPSSIFSIYQNITLHKFVGDLPDIHVKVDLPITKHGDTTIYKVAAFEKGNENTLGDLLQKLPGINVDENGRVSFNGKRISRILVEDDDMFGSNYTSLINNSGISGIEKIEVIENYSDKTRIENSFTSGSETVLNLRYKKGLKLFGNTTFSKSVTNNFYETKLSSTGLFKKHKFVLNLNSNKIGNLANNIIGNVNDAEIVNDDNEKLPLNVKLSNAPIQLNDIIPIGIKSARVFENISHFLSVNYLFKLNGKLNFKAKFNILSDDYAQSFTSIETINNPILPIVYVQTNATNKLNCRSNIFLELNWKPSNKLQTIFQYNRNDLSLNQQRFGSLFTRNIGQSIYEVKKQDRLSIISTKVLTKSSTLNSHFFYNSYFLKNNYQIQNPLIDTLFNADTTYSNLLQVYDLPTEIFAAEIRFNKWVKSLKYQIQFQSSIENSNLSTSTFLFNLSNSLAKYSDSFNSTVKLSDKRNTLSVSVSKKFSQKLTTNLSLQLLNTRLSIFKNYQSEKKYYNNLIALPSFNGQYKISEKRIFLFGFNPQQVLPNVQQLNSNFVMSSFTGIFKGSNDFNSNIGYNLNAGYLFFDIINSGIIYNAFFFQSNMPPNYLNNLSGRGLFLINETIPFNKNNLFNTFSTKIEKRFSRIKTWITLQSNITLSKQFLFTNNLLTLNKGRVIQFEGKLRTNWSNWFNVNASLLVRSQNQKSIINNVETNKFYSKETFSNIIFTIQPIKKIFIDIHSNLVFNKPQDKPTRSLLFTDVMIKYNASNKFDLGFQVRNLFNKKSFQQYDVSVTQSSLDTYNLLPFFAMISLQYKF